jgi:hypothetical protein
MKDSQIKSLITKIDKHNPDVKASDPEWRRNQVRALAKGSIEPAPKPEPIAKQKKAKGTALKPKKVGSKGAADVSDLLSFKSAGVTRKR